MYGVFVYWKDAPTRAERLSNGYTTTRVMHATVFSSEQDARTAGTQAVDGIDGVASWEVRPFHGRKRAER